jgi:predicted PurR-regulated permease PerM
MAIRSTQEPSASSRPSLTPASLFLILLLFWIVTQVQLVLVLGLLALLFGTILEGPVRFLQKQRFPRPAAILAVYIVIIGALALLVVAIAPGIADQFTEFTDNAPSQLRNLRDEWRASDNGLLNGPGVGVIDRAIELVEGDEQVNVSQDAVAQAIPVLTSITGGLVSTVTLLVMTFYYLLEKRLLRDLILDALSPRMRDRVDGLWTEVENKVGRWMRGQLLLCLIIGTIATVSYGIIGLNFWPLLGLWAGITEIIPIVGPWIGGIPAVLIALTMSWKLAITTAIIIVAMQTLENWVLVPRVMKGAVGLTPLTVFIAILAGTQFMGVVGAVLAIPIAATIQVILTDFLERRSVRDERMTARAGWRWMLSRGVRDDVDGDGTLGPDGRPIPRAEDDYGDGLGAGEEGDTIPGPAATYGPDLDEIAFADEAPDEAILVDEPVAEVDGGPEPPRRQPGPPAERDAAEEPAADEPPAFAAWPRRPDEQRKRPPSSTWPPLEQGRPERLRRRGSDES